MGIKTRQGFARISKCILISMFASLQGLVSYAFFLGITSFFNEIKRVVRAAKKYFLFWYNLLCKEKINVAGDHTYLVCLFTLDILHRYDVTALWCLSLFPGTVWNLTPMQNIKISAAAAAFNDYHFKVK